MKTIIICLLSITVFAKTCVALPSPTIHKTTVSVFDNTPITLDGSGSSDQDGTILSYQWKQIGTTPNLCTIKDPSAVITTAQPAGTGQWLIGVYKFSLTVTDNSNVSRTDTMLVNVIPNPDIPPVAKAGPDVTVQLPINKATLTSSSTDADGTVSGYAWTLISGPNGSSFSTPGSAQTDINGLVAGVYQVRLKAIDNLGSSTADTLVITVLAAANLPPKADAGPDKTIVLPVSTVAIGGTDIPNSSSMTVLWSKLSGPSGGAISSPSLSFTQVSNLVNTGTYVFQKKVTNNTGRSSIDSVKVTVKKKCKWWQFFGC